MHVCGYVLENVPDVTGTFVFVLRDAVRVLCHACRHDAISTEALCHAYVLVYKRRILDWLSTA